MAIRAVWVEFKTAEKAQSTLNKLTGYITPASEHAIRGVTEDRGRHNEKCLTLSLRRPDDESEAAFKEILSRVGEALGAQRISSEEIELWHAV